MPSDSGGKKKNKMSQLLIQDTLLKLTINFNHTEKMVITHGGNPFQNVHKWTENFEDVISSFNLKDLCKLIFAKQCMARKKLKSHPPDLGSRSPHTYAPGGTGSPRIAHGYILPAKEEYRPITSLLLNPKLEPLVAPTSNTKIL